MQVGFAVTCGDNHVEFRLYGPCPADRPALEALIRRAPVEDLGWLDKDVLVQCLRRAALGVAPGGAGVTRLDLTLAWLTWLSLQEDGCRALPAPVDVLHADRPATHAGYGALPGRVVPSLR